MASIMDSVLMAAKDALATGKRISSPGINLPTGVTPLQGYDSTVKPLTNPLQSLASSTSNGLTAQGLLPMAGASVGSPAPQQTAQNLTLANIKEAIAKNESGGEKNPYAAKSKSSTASGKYQYLDSTWGNYGGYKRAADAPPDLQEKRMSEDVARLAKRYNNDPSLIAVAHFQGAGIADKIKQNPALWDKKDANGLTTRDYVSRLTGSSAQASTSYAGNIPKNIPGYGQLKNSKSNPNTVQTFLELHEKFGAGFSGIVGDANHQKKKSDHNDWSAVDSSVSSPEMRRQAAEYVVQNAERLKVKYVIEGDQIWSPEKGWRKYSGSFHNHVHTSNYK